jgi:hypothetical protein
MTCGWKQSVKNSWKKFVAKCVEDGLTLVCFILKQNMFLQNSGTVEGGAFK